MRGLLIVDDVKTVATLFAVVELKSNGDGPGGASPVRGVSSRVIVLVRTLASAGACAEFRLITPARMGGEAVGVGVGIGVVAGA